MTRSEAENRLSELETKRDALVDQLADADVSSASLSAGGGSKSFSNRSVEELKAKIKVLGREIARISYRLGRSPNPDAITSIKFRYGR